MDDSLIPDIGQTRELSPYDKTRLAPSLQIAAVIMFLVGLVGMLFLAATILGGLLRQGYALIGWWHGVQCLIWLMPMLAAAGLLRLSRGWRLVAMMLLWAGVVLAVAETYVGCREVRAASTESDDKYMGALFYVAVVSVFWWYSAVVPLLLLTSRRAVEQFGLRYYRARRRLALTGIIATAVGSIAIVAYFVG